MSCQQLLATCLTAHGDGCVVSLTASPRSSANRLELTDDGALRVRLTAPPVDGAANAALIKALANVLGVPRGTLTVIAGSTSRHKRVAVTGVAPADAAAALCRAIASDRV